MASPLIAPICMLTNQLCLDDLEAVQAHIASLISGMSRPPIPATLARQTNQVLRDMEATLTGKPLGRRHTPDLPKKENLIAEVERLWPLHSIDLCRSATALVV
jgi:hypothetical protein